MAVSRCLEGVEMATKQQMTGMRGVYLVAAELCKRGLLQPRPPGVRRALICWLLTRTVAELIPSR